MAAATGLSPADLTAIRAALTNGRRPRVVFTEAAGQIAGQVGQIIQLADPAEAEEWIVVRFGRDELPFSPSDLAVPVRGARPAEPPTPSNGTGNGAANGPGKGSTGRQRAGARPALSPTFQPSPAPPSPTPPPRSSVAAAQPRSAVGSVEAVARPTPGAAAESPNGSAAAGPKPPARPKSPANLVVTLAYAEREWTLAATYGAKTLAKPHAIKPAEALRMVALVDVPGLHEAVESIITAERSEAEQRAARLRTELAELESRLAELTARG